MGEFRIELDHRSGVPIYRQIISQILYAIARQELLPGQQLPTVRSLAVDLSVNPNTVIKAYKELEIRGNLETQQGSGTFISTTEVKVSARERKKLLGTLCRDVIGRAQTYGISLREVIAALEHANKEK